MKEGQVEGLLRRAVFHTTTQAEMWYGGAIDSNLLLAAHTRISEVQWVNLILANKLSLIVKYLFLLNSCFFRGWDYTSYQSAIVPGPW